MTRIPACALALVFASGVSTLCADAKVDKGKELFTAQKCSVCHSIAGKGNPKGKLDSVGSTLSAEEIRLWITDPTAMAAKAKAERKPPMKPKAMPAEDVDALVAYLSTLKEK
jgi:mono/diheme cytochrome c family protein